MRRGKIIFSSIVIVAIGFFLLRPVFSGQWVLPQGLSMGAVTVRYYGLILGLALIAGYLLAAYRAPRYGLSVQQLDKILFWLVLCGFGGARLYHVAVEFGYYRVHPGQILAFWHGGLSIFGALLGGLVGLAVAQRLLPRQSYLKLLDWLAPSLLSGQIIGRFGNLFNYELYGYPTNLPWKMFVPALFRLPGWAEAQFFHPLFLYEALLGAIFLWLLLKVVGSARKAGTLFFTYLFLYNAGRFFLEFLRPDSVFWGSFRLNAGVSGLLALVGVAGLIYLHYASSSSSHS